jgi:hypothetical protein
MYRRAALGAIIANVGELRRGAGPGRRRRAQARTALRLILFGVLLLLLAPAFAYYGIMLSGRLALTQQAPAGDVLRGFDFGPVYLEKDEPGRYYIAATLPDEQAGVGQTRFEVLDAQKRPVFRQDEIRIIGDYHFAPGERESYRGFFRLSEGTGYYYFRFKAESGVYDPQASAPPVVSFAVRQGVLAGWSVWGPVAALVALGLALIGCGFRSAAAVALVDTHEPRHAEPLVEEEGEAHEPLRRGGSRGRRFINQG